jgi:hypothetical protein
MLCCQRQSGREGQHAQRSTRRYLHVPIKGVDRRKKKTRYAHVRGHQRTVSKDVGLEHKQNQRHKCCQGSEHFACAGEQ